jgi:hypothetical protein
MVAIRGHSHAEHPSTLGCPYLSDRDRRSRDMPIKVGLVLPAIWKDLYGFEPMLRCDRTVGYQNRREVAVEGKPTHLRAMPAPLSVVVG